MHSDLAELIPRRHRAIPRAKHCICVKPIARGRDTIASVTSDILNNYEPRFGPFPPKNRQVHKTKTMTDVCKRQKLENRQLYKKRDVALSCYKSYT